MGDTEPATPVLILPGLSDSGPEHWQSIWEREHPEYRRVHDIDWYKPDATDWVRGIERAVGECLRPPVVVAHSLGCIALAHWARATERHLAGAMLVAPPDMETAHTRYDVSGFAPFPRERLPFRSIVVASNNDPWCPISRAKELAASWGSSFVNAGACGHINVDAGFGPWPRGEALLKDFLAHSTV